MFGTGQGPLTPSVSDGQAAGFNPIPITTTVPQVSLGGVNVPVDFSGAAPNFVGLWQINVRVPKNAPIGDVPVAVVFNGINSRADQFGNGRSTAIMSGPTTLSRTAPTVDANAVGAVAGKKAGARHRPGR